MSCRNEKCNKELKWADGPFMDFQLVSTDPIGEQVQIALMKILSPYSTVQSILGRAFCCNLYMFGGLRLKREGGCPRHRFRE